MDNQTLIELSYIKNAPNREKAFKSFEGSDFLTYSGLQEIMPTPEQRACILRTLLSRPSLCNKPPISYLDYIRRTESGKNILEVSDKMDYLIKTIFC